MNQSGSPQPLQGLLRELLQFGGVAPKRLVLPDKSIAEMVESCIRGQRNVTAYLNHFRAMASYNPFSKEAYASAKILLFPPRVSILYIRSLQVS